MPTKITATCKMIYRDLKNEICEIEPIHILLTKTYLGYAEVVIAGDKDKKDLIDFLYNNQNQEVTLLNQLNTQPVGYKINKNCLIKKNDTTLWVDYPLKNFSEIEQVLLT